MWACVCREFNDVALENCISKARKDSKNCTSEELMEAVNQEFGVPVCGACLPSIEDRMSQLPLMQLSK